MGKKKYVTVTRNVLITVKGKKGKPKYTKGKIKLRVPKSKRDLYP